MISKELKESYRKHRNIAAGVVVAIMLVFIFRKVLGYENRDQWYINVLLLGYAISYIAACWFYLKWKQRSGGWLLLIPTGIIGLIVYICLKDRSEMPDNIQCPSCQAFNFPADLNCRLCKTPMPKPHSNQEALA